MLNSFHKYDYRCIRAAKPMNMLRIKKTKQQKIGQHPNESQGNSVDILRILLKKLNIGVTTVQGRKNYALRKSRISSRKDSKSKLLQPRNYSCLSSQHEQDTVVFSEHIKSKCLEDDIGNSLVDGTELKNSACAATTSNTNPDRKSRVYI